MHRQRLLTTLPPRRNAAWALGCVLLGACVGAAPDAPEGESDDATAGPVDGDMGSSDVGTATGTSSGSGGSGSSDGADSGSDDGAPLARCEDPQELPPAPFDCAGAEGVLAGHALIEPGEDDPSILMGVRRVEGSVRINRIALDNLDFMACVQEVTGDVTIYGNAQLTNVDGLWSLTSIGTDFVLSENNALTDFDGLPNVVTVPRNLVIKNNAALETITGFQQLEAVGDNLLIQQNDTLGDVNGLGGLRTVGGVFAVTQNPSLCISSVNCVGLGITEPATPPPGWSTQANDFGC